MIVAWNGTIMQDRNSIRTMRLPRKFCVSAYPAMALNTTLAAIVMRRDHDAVEEKARERDGVPDIDVDRTDWDRAE